MRKIEDSGAVAVDEASRYRQERLPTCSFSTALATEAHRNCTKIDKVLKMKKMVEECVIRCWYNYRVPL